MGLGFGRVGGPGGVGGGGGGGGLDGGGGDGDVTLGGGGGGGAVGGSSGGGGGAVGGSGGGGGGAVGGSGGSGGGGGGNGGGGGGGGGGQPVVKVTLLHEDSQEFRDLVARFLSFHHEHDHKFIDVLTIEAIQNQERWTCFKLVEADHRRNVARLPPDSRNRPAGQNTVELLHGSSHMNLRNIALNGFNLESDPANGAIYGKGAYFT